MTYNIKVPPRIEQIIYLFYLIGLWQDDNRTNFRKWVWKIFHLAVYVYYPVSLAVGALTNDNENARMFLVVLSIVTFVLAVRLYYILWKKDQIIKFIIEMGAHSIEDNEQFCFVNNKIRVFIKFVTYLQFMLVSSVIAMTIITSPIFSNEKMLPMNIYFPLDWKNNELFYWIAFLFVNYEMMISLVSALLNTIVWYLLMSFGIKYQTLGNQFKNLGSETERKGILVRENQELFNLKLVELIKNHHGLQE